MGALSNIFTRLWEKFAKVRIPGTITAIGGENSLYPTAIANEILGGHHSYDSVEDLASIPIARLAVGMTATVKQHTRPSGEVVKRTRYVLESLPPDTKDRISEFPNYDISLYWKVDTDIVNFEGTLQTQYAPNCDPLTGIPVATGGSTPPYPGLIRGLKISYEEYAQLTIGNSVSLTNGGIVEGYWADVYEPKHVWMRERTGANGKWSRPYKVNGEGYESGDYIENRFKWSLTKPDTPPQFTNGLPNNEPVGWADMPPINPNDGSKLWMIRGEKDKYQRLESPWLPPIEITVDGNLVRYSEKPTPNPNDVVYVDLESKGWETMLDNSRHRYMATRENLGSGTYSAWNIIKIAQESGEYTSYIFRKYKTSSTQDIINNPDTYRPTGATPAGWLDTPSETLGLDELWFVSMGRKYLDGELIAPWSDPIPFSGQDVILSLITTSNGDDFKKDKAGVVTPAEITLTAEIYKGVTPLTPESITWTRVYNGGDLDTTSFGITTSITVAPEDVEGFAVFQCEQVFDSVTYTSEISIMDIADGIDAKSLNLTSNSNIITRKTDGSFAPASITLKARSANLTDAGSFTWFKDGVQVTDVDGLPYKSDTLSVLYSDFTADKEITYKVSSVDGLYDEYTIYELAEASGGAPAITVVLSNESHTIVQDEATGTLDTTGAFSFVKVYEGATDVTGFWSFTKTDTNVTSTLDISDTTKPKVTVTDINAGVKSGYVTVRGTRDSNVVTKQFSINRIVDPVGAILLDISSSVGGFAFAPNNTAPKTLKSVLYVDGTAVTYGVTYKWFFDSTPKGTSDTQVISMSEVNYSTTVKCEATYKEKTYTRVVNITDVKDSKGLGILYSTSTSTLSNSDRPKNDVLYNAASGTSSSGTVSWTNSSSNAIWMSIRREGETVWSTPARIKGEKGDQGIVGNSIRNIFMVSAIQPSTPTGNWLPNLWSDNPPSTIGTLWVSYGEITPTGVLVGAWSTPKQINGNPGIKGDKGEKGDKGDKGDNGDPTLSADLITNAGTGTCPQGFHSTYTDATNRYGYNNIYNPSDIKKGVMIVAYVLVARDSSVTDSVTFTLSLSTDGGVTYTPVQNNYYKLDFDGPVHAQIIWVTNLDSKKYLHLKAHTTVTTGGNSRHYGNPVINAILI